MLALTLVVVAVYTLTTKSSVELVIIDSQIDQLLYLVMMFGGAGICTAISVSMLRNSLAKKILQ